MAIINKKSESRRKLHVYTVFCKMLPKPALCYHKIVTEVGGEQFSVFTKTWQPLEKDLKTKLLLSQQPRKVIF